MDFSEIRELVVDYFQNTLADRKRLIDQGLLDFDTKQSYRMAIKHLARDMQLGNEKPEDLFVPESDFKAKCQINKADWDANKDDLLPLLRDATHNQLTEVIAYRKPRRIGM